MANVRSAQSPVSLRRRLCRWCMQILGGFVMLLLLALLYLNQIGLPSWPKEVLLGQLQERGIQLEFRRIRVRMARGIVAEDVHFSRSTPPPSSQDASPQTQSEPDFHADEVQLRLNWSTLLAWDVPQITALTLANARVLLPLADPVSNERFSIAVSDVQARLLFSDANVWELEDLNGTFHGGRFRASGSLTNAALLRRRRPASPPPSTRWQRDLLGIARWLENASFDQPPTLAIHFVADLRNPHSSTMDLRFVAGGAITRHGDFNDVDLHLQWNASPDGSESSSGALRLTSARAQTPWGEYEAMTLNVNGLHSPAHPMPEEVEWNLVADKVTVDSMTASHLDVTGTSRKIRDPDPNTPRRPLAPLVGSRAQRILTSASRLRSILDTLPLGTNASPIVTPPDLEASAFDVYETRLSIQADQLNLPIVDDPRSVGRVNTQIDVQHTLNDWLALDVVLEVAGVQGRNAQLGSGSLKVHARPKTDFIPLADAEALPTYLTWLREGQFDVALAATNVAIQPRVSQSGAVNDPAVRMLTVQADLASRDAHIELTNAEIRFRDNGRLSLKASVDATSRQAEASVLSSFNVQLVQPWLRDASRNWIKQYGWKVGSPPLVAGTVTATLPEWNTPTEEWSRALLPSVHARGVLQGKNVSFRSVPADVAKGEFWYKDRIWHVPHFEAHTPSGWLRFDYEGSEITKDYQFNFESRLDPLAARPMLADPVHAQQFTNVTFTVPPLVIGQVWGRWKDLDRTGAVIDLTATDFVLRGEPVRSAAGRIEYTNHFVNFKNVIVDADGPGRVESAGYDIKAGLLYLTNAWGHLPPAKIARIIGPVTAGALDPFQFVKHPIISLSGIIPVKKAAQNQADAWFDVEAPEFHWWRVHTLDTRSRLHYLGKTLLVTNIVTQTFGGTAGGHLLFDFNDQDRTPFSAELRLTNAELQTLMLDLVQTTNRLEGRVSGAVQLTSGLTGDMNTWKGFGQVGIVDGYLWGLPLFGMFSPVFEAIIPGLGESRFSAGSATFQFDKYQLTTSDLELRSPAMRLDYKGTVDFDGNLDALMEAQLFRDAPLVGPILNFALSPITKLLEYRVRGTLGKPELEPRYVPKFLFNILRPIQTLKGLLPSEPVVPPARKSDE